MKTNTKRGFGGLTIAAAVAALLAGCATQQQAQPKTTAPSLTPQAAAQPAASPDPRFRVAATAFPTGNRATSALLVEKTVPTQVLVGQPFDIVYKVSNLTDITLQDVTLTDNTAANFKLDQATPKADNVEGGLATWAVGDLGPKQSKEVRIRGSALQEGVVTGCATATFRPFVCETIQVVKPAIQLTKTLPAQVVQCDPIPVKLVVKNNGTSELTNVRVTDALPSGLLTEAGQANASFDAGTLAPGQSKEFVFNAKASKTGKYNNPAKATSAQGVEAQAEAAVTVVKPALTVECSTPSMKEMGNLRFTEFIGRPFEVCWTVKNTGDAASANTVLEVPVPAGLTFKSATGGGALSGSTVSWNLDSLAPEASKKVCATFSGANGGSYGFNASTKGVCAEPATAACSVVIQGVNAILVEVVDDPDPIQVGEQTTYTVRVTNQGGGLDLLNVAVKAIFPTEVDPVSASNNATVSGKTVTWPAVANLPLKQTLTYTVTGKATAAGDARLKVEVTTRERQEPITELESTTAY